MANINIATDSIIGIMKKINPLDAGHAIPKQDSGLNLKAMKKEIDEKRAEQAKTYGFIGMEVYDLAKEDKIDIPQIKNYLEKIDEINNEIQELETKIKEQEKRNAGKNICSCGYKLKPSDKFCPNCGEPVPGIVICPCGAQLDENAKFCSSCGRKMEDIMKEQETPKELPMRECICGAKVPAGQFMCMECGRKLEN